MRTETPRSGWLAMILATLSAPGMALLAAGGPARADDDPGARPAATIRDGFETPKAAWRQEQPDAAIEIYSHERTRRAAHEGEFSEGFEFKAGIGGGLYYSYALPRVPVSDATTASLYVRSNRAGVQMLARVFLPADVDPDSRQPSFVLVPGSIYEATERWQKVVIDDMLPAIERQARVLRAATHRKVSLEGAYIERLIVNIYGGEGVTEVYLDELEVGPVAPEAVAAHDRKLGRTPAEVPEVEPLPEGATVRPIADRPRGGAGAGPLDPNLPTAAERVKFDRNRLFLDGHPWFPVMMRAPDVDPADARHLGMDALVVPEDADADYLTRAVQSGLFLIPELWDEAAGPTGKGPRVDPERVLTRASSFAGKEHVLAWSLGRDLGGELDLAERKASLRAVRDAILELRRAKPGGTGLATGTIVGGLADFARIPENLDLLGLPARTWGTCQGPFEPYRFYEQRRFLTVRSNADALMWAEVDVTAPPVYQRMIWGQDRPPAWGVPAVQPEQVRMATYAALAGGCRGICFRADGGLAQGPGRMAAIEMMLLNLEVDLMEPILADPDRSIRLLNTYDPPPPPPQPMMLFQMNAASQTRPPQVKEMPPSATVKAAAISTKDRRGTLLMINDFMTYAQQQPPQMAKNKLRVVAPAANDALAYLISPGGVKVLDMTRGPGGQEIVLEDFGVTALVLVTTNVALKDQIEAAVNRIRPKAISMAIEQAELQRAWVAQVDSEIQAQARHPQKDSAELIAAADRYIQSARDALERADYPTAWDDARRAGRPLRILMRYHFMDAYDSTIKALNDEDLPCGPVVYEGDDKPKPRLVAPIVSAPLAAFNTLPQAWQWLDWMRTGRLGRSIIPGGDFNFADEGELADAGWTVERYETDDLQSKVGLPLGGPDNVWDKEGKGHKLAISVKPRPGKKLDEVVPFLDNPAIAVRSPAVPVLAGQMYRVSCMVFASNNTPEGAGGLFIRDSFGGERLQYRTPVALDKNWFQVVYYRRIPADGDFSVTLGMAAVTGYCLFDDLKVEPIVGQDDPAQQPAVARRGRSTGTPAAFNPDGTPVAPPSAERPARSAARVQPVPIRQ